MSTQPQKGLSSIILILHSPTLTKIPWNPKSLQLNFTWTTWDKSWCSLSYSPYQKELKNEKAPFLPVLKAVCTSLQSACNKGVRYSITQCLILPHYPESTKVSEVHQGIPSSRSHSYLNAAGSWALQFHKDIYLICPTPAAAPLPFILGALLMTL